MNKFKSSLELAIYNVQGVLLLLDKEAEDIEDYDLDEIST